MRFAAKNNECHLKAAVNKVGDKIRKILDLILKLKITNFASEGTVQLQHEVLAFPTAYCWQICSSGTSKAISHKGLLETDSTSTAPHGMEHKSSYGSRRYVTHLLIFSTPNLQQTDLQPPCC